MNVYNKHIGTTEVTIAHYGIHAEHNMPCSTCYAPKVKAVFDCNTSLFQPCWECQKAGYVTLKLTRFQKWLLRK